jgi:hypothetical protein
VDRDDPLGSQDFHEGVRGVYDQYELDEERPLQHAVVAEFKVCYLSGEHFEPFVVSCAPQTTIKLIILRSLADAPRIMSRNVSSTGCSADSRSLS